MEYDNTNRGVLFQNERKTTDKHPDYTGTININGVEHYLAGWKKVSQKGKVFLSLKIGEMVKAKTQEATPPPAEDTISIDDIPF